MSGYLGSFIIDDTCTFYANTHTPSTGAAVDADAVPGYRVYEDETATPILTGSMALLDDTNTVGFYSEQITLSAANGFEAGKSYCIRITLVVGGVTGVQLAQLQIGARVDVRMLGGGVQSATDLKDFADDGYDPSTNKVQGVVLTDTLTTYTGNTVQTGDSFARIGATGSGLTTLATAANLATAAAFIDTEVASILAEVDTEVAAIKAKTDNLPVDPADESAIQASIAALNNLSAVAVENAVWNATMASHLTGGSTGASLNGAGSAGDPWTTALPGAYGAGTAGALVGTVPTILAAVDTEVASILAAVDTEVAAIKAVTDALPNSGTLSSLATAASITALPAALLDLAAGIETGLTLRQALRLIAAACAGKASGLETATAVYRSAVADNADRITASVDADGNRTAITYNLA